jgi:hypothetical protein
VANVLCEGHNNGMSHLDQAAIDFATFLQSIALSFLGGNGSWGSGESIRISGDDFQRWVLKLLLNHAAVNAFTIGEGERIMSRIPPTAVRLLLGKGAWPATGGLCVAATPGHRLKFDPFTSDQVITKWWGAEPFHSRTDRSLCGGIVELAGVSFGLSLDNKIRSFPSLLDPDNPLRDTLRQPGYMAWRLDGVEKRIDFDWSDSAQHEGITYTLHLD